MIKKSTRKMAIFRALVTLMTKMRSFVML